MRRFASIPVFLAMIPGLLTAGAPEGRMQLWRTPGRFEITPQGGKSVVRDLRGFEVRDVESLREHYALTLGQWVRRLEAHAEEARQLTNEVFYRIWRLYMAAAVHAFRTGRTNIYQTLLAKPDRGMSGLPLRRADWYT